MFISSFPLDEEDRQDEDEAERDIPRAADDTGNPLRARRLELTGTPVARPDLDTPRLKLTEEAEGRWRGEGPLLSAAGRWSLVAVVEAAGGRVAVPLQLDVPGSARPDRDRPTEPTCGLTCPATSPAPTRPDRSAA